MNTVLCAQIVWAETKDIIAGSEDTKQMLRELRGHIAALAVVTDGEPFPRRLAWTNADVTADGAALAECIELAKSAIQDPSDPGWCVLIWSGKGADDTGVPADAPSGWTDFPRADLATLGPFVSRGKEVRAYIARRDVKFPVNDFASIVTGSGLSASIRPLIAPVGAPVLRHRGSKFWGYALAAAALVTFVAASAWTLNAGAVAFDTYNIFKLMPESTDCAVSPADLSNAASVTPVEWLTRIEKPAGAKNCAAIWLKAQLQAFATPIEDRWSRWWRETVRSYSFSASTGELSLRRPLGLMMLSMLLLIFSAGVGVLGRPFGILIDPTNKISLTRSQLAAWMVVIVGGWATLALFDIGFSVATLRDLMQVDTDQGHANSVAASLSYPTMNWQLWALLGISLATPGVAALLAQPAPAAKADGAVSDRKAPDVYKNSPADADLSDLVYGETAENQNVVDPARVQYIGFTAVLVATYVYSLLEFCTGIDGLRAIRAVEHHQPIFGSMPAMGDSFVGLLVLTHGTLLLGKYYDHRASAEAAHAG